jgi:hypothetical protein
VCIYRFHSFCSACRERALEELSRLSSPGACAAANLAFQRGVAVVLVVVWYAASENLEPAHLNDRISVVTIIRCTGDKPALDTVYDGVA